MNQKDYHCGVIDAFNEMVANGVKQLALSHPFDSSEERKEMLPFVEAICAKYHTSYYLEDRPLISDLFPAAVNKNKYMILFYRDEQVIRHYLNLTQVKAESLRRKEYFTVRAAIAYQFGALLSYPQQRIAELIAANTDKEQYEER